MNDQKKLETLKEIVLQKKQLERDKKHLGNLIKINDDKIDEEILESGNIENCKSRLLENGGYKIEKKKVGGVIKRSIEMLEDLIMGEGEFNEEQLDIFDVAGEDNEETEE